MLRKAVGSLVQILGNLLQDNLHLFLYILQKGILIFLSQSIDRFLPFAAMLPNHVGKFLCHSARPSFNKGYNLLLGCFFLFANILQKFIHGLNIGVGLAFTQFIDYHIQVSFYFQNTAAQYLESRHTF